MPDYDALDKHYVVFDILEATCMCWALEEGYIYVTNMENLKMGSKSLYLMLNTIHHSHGTVANCFVLYLGDLLLKMLEIYKNSSKSVNF